MLPVEARGAGHAAGIALARGIGALSHEFIQPGDQVGSVYAVPRISAYLAAQYARIRGRRGPGRAAVAIGHSILVIAWHLLSTGETYTDLGGDYFEKRRTSTARQHRLVAQLEAMGHKVTLEPAA